VSFYSWMLALHLLAAFAIAAALVLFSVLVYSGRRMATLDDTRLLFRIAPIGTPLITAGSVLALILGIVLAIDSPDIHPWDGWVVAAYILWAALGGVGQQSGAYYIDVQKLADSGAEQEVIARLRASKGMLLHLVTVLVFLLLLLDMLFKPGA
jgi:hypothetical protein